MLSLAFTSALLSGQVPVEERQLELLLNTIATVRQELEQTRADRSSVYVEIESSEKAIADVEAKIAAINIRLATAQNELASLQDEAAELELARSRQQAILMQYLVNAWQSARLEKLQLLLNQQNLRKTARMLQFYNYFSEARAERIAAFTLTLQQLAELSSSIEVTTAMLDQEYQALSVQESVLEAQQSERRQVLDTLDIALAEGNNQIQQLEFEKIELELLLEELQRAVTDLTPDGANLPFADMKGSLNWPVDGPVSNNFGSSHELGDLTWEGITISAQPGSPIKAIHPGRVVFSDWFGNSGLLLIIDHGDGYMSLYAHNQALMKTVGDWVAAGETIAATGNTGGQREAALYFEIRRNGTAINPVEWLGKR